MSKISMDKTYRYRHGEMARILCIDRPTFPNLPVVSIGAKSGEIVYHDAEGMGIRHDCGPRPQYDLIEVRPRIKRTVWLNIDMDGHIHVNSSRELAECMRHSDRIACIKVDLDFEEGEGL